MNVCLIHNLRVAIATRSTHAQQRYGDREVFLRILRQFFVAFVVGIKRQRATTLCLKVQVPLYRPTADFEVKHMTTTSRLSVCLSVGRAECAL